MIKYIVTSGCSFSDPKGNPTTWPIWLENSLSNIKFIHKGLGCSGNTYIYLSLVHEIDKLINTGVSPSEILVIPMWSGIHRKDFFVNDKETVEYKSVLKERDHPPGINSLDGSFITKNNYQSSGLLTSGGFQHNRGNFIIDNYLYEYYLNYYTFEGGWANTLMCVTGLQTLCSSTGVNLLNLSWQNIFTVPDNDDGRGGHCSSNKIDLTTVTPNNDRYPAYKFLYNFIDFNKWWTFDNPHIKKGGLGEWCLYNDYPLDGNHPIKEAHKAFVKDVVISEIRSRYDISN